MHSPSHTLSRFPTSWSFGKRTHTRSTPGSLVVLRGSTMSKIYGYMFLLCCWPPGHASAKIHLWKKITPSSNSFFNVVILKTNREISAENRLQLNWFFSFWNNQNDSSSWFETSCRSTFNDFRAVTIFSQHLNEFRWKLFLWISHLAEDKTSNVNTFWRKISNNKHPHSSVPNGCRVFQVLLIQ